MSGNGETGTKSWPEKVLAELKTLFVPSSSDRPMTYPLAVALAAALPLAVGAWLGDIGKATGAAIAGMTIAYLPRSTLSRRLVTVMACAWAMIACYALGQLASLVPHARVPVVMLATLLVTMGCRYYRIAPPGNLFFVIAAGIGAYLPAELSQVPERLGIFALGTISAIIIAFLYSARITRLRKPEDPKPPPEDIAGDVITDAMVFALAVGIGLGLAEWFNFERPYWVVVSCLAVLQGPHLKAVWRRQVQRIIGTIVGLFLAAFLLNLANSPWHIAAMVFVLMYAMQFIVVRNYAIASVVITPYAVILAETAMGGTMDAGTMMAARFLDTVLGAVMGLLGGFFLHQETLRGPLRRAVARVVHLPTR